MFLDLVDESDRVVWNVSDFGAIPFSQVVRSAATGTIRGDVSRIYLVLQAPAGNGMLVDWPTLVDGWRVAYAVIEHTAAFGGALAAVTAARKLLKNRLRRGIDTVRRYRPAWTQRGGAPHNLETLIRNREWRSEDLSAVLGCSEGDAEAVLEIFGFEEKDGRWRPGSDPISRVLQAVHDEIQYSYHLRYSEFEPLLHERLTSYLADGQRPSEEETEASPYEAFELIGFTVAEDALTYQVRLGESVIGGQVPLYHLDEASDIDDLTRRIVRRELRRMADAADAESD
jgi:hypothetical protein